MTEPRAHLLLASASPRRRELLEQIGIRCRVLPVDVDETILDQEPPLTFVERLARIKARAGRESQTVLPALGADTCVVADKHILGKPESAAHAVEMLQQLSGREHLVYTAVAIARQHCLSSVQVSAVRFRSLTLDECRRYAATGEPLDKAGGYAVQGLAACFIARIEGSFSGIMGLPLFETARLLNLSGIRVF